MKFNYLKFPGTPYPRPTSMSRYEVLARKIMSDGNSQCKLCKS